MAEHKMINNYRVFEEWSTDTMGTNFRVARMENLTPTVHKLLCVVNPLISANAERWRRVKILLDGIKKSSIPSLFSPEEIMVANDQVSLIYNYFRGKSLKRVLERSIKMDIPISFDLAFSIAIAIADIIEAGSSIIISGEKSFHGFLTPDNILVHYDGKIALKNYGIFPYLDKAGPFFSDLEAKYGTWLTPEFLKQEKTIAQSDIYHLGYLIYRMLTGKYFSQQPAEAFDSQFDNLHFRTYLPFSDKETIAGLTTFFKKTLHPDPLKRFLTIKEFKDFVGNYFHIEELSSITFSLAYFMNSLYADIQTEEEKVLQDELAFHPPEPKAAPAPTPPEPERKADRVDNMLGELDRRKKPRRWIWGAAAAAIIVASVGGYLVVQQTQKAKRIEAELARQRTEQKQELDRQITAVKEDLERKTREHEQKLNLSAEEQKKLAEDKLKLQGELKKLQQTELDRVKAAEEQRKQQEEQDRVKKEDEAKRQQEEQDRVKKEDEAKKQQEELDRKKLEEKKVKPGDLVGIADVTIRPVKISGNPPRLTDLLRRKYSQQTMPIVTMALIDENGNVSKVSVFGSVPEDIKTLITDTLSGWKYSPAQKDTVAVKVYLPVKFNIVF